LAKVRFPIVGMAHHKPAPTIMSLLPAGTPLYLELEPTNPYDPNAIKVWIEDFSAHTDSEGIEAVQQSCVAEEIECPALDQPIFLGYVKAKTIDDEHLGADTLAPRIQAMLESGEISDPKEIPIILYYGASGRPSFVIEGSSETETLEAPANETANLPIEDFSDEGAEAAATDIQSFSDTQD
jgi:hypothetical protein